MGTLKNIVLILNGNSGALQVLFASVLSVITAVYAYLTYKIVVETREQNRPYIFLDFDIHDGSFDLSISNLGNRVARNVKFNVQRDIVTTDGLRLSELEVIRDGISYFPPKRRFLFSFDVEHSFFKDRNDDELLLLFSVSYSYNKISYSDEYKFDLSLYKKNMLFRSFSDLGSIVNSGLKDISRSLRKDTARDVLISFNRNMGKTPCPVCKETIKSDASKCHYCGEWIKRKQGEYEV